MDFILSRIEISKPIVIFNTNLSNRIVKDEGFNYRDYIKNFKQILLNERFKSQC